MIDWSNNDLNDLIARKQSGLFYLFTPMCGTCQVAGKMLTITEQLLQKLPIGKADLNFLPAVAEKYEIESVPCLLVFKKGELVDKLYAFHSVPYLLEQIQSYELQSQF
ncbi:thioredoxin family protein [Cytobacillus kochii]|uniref:thioredoxin family protein n=1 Tax=Cytobacillus kochii TaxID=859143 RepID=UPI00203EB6F2|nr:thioredoxin family protein [Cytobacillus kochii]MCM3324894.1 thioredoxin family protein [Cytobacillus kochii]MCM3347314.1 thioredoxin family protein [Cytobacillus kochii]